MYSVQVPSIHARGTASQRSSRAHPFKPRWTSFSSPGSSMFSNCVVIFVRFRSFLLRRPSHWIQRRFVTELFYSGSSIARPERATRRRCCGNKGQTGVFSLAKGTAWAGFWCGSSSSSALVGQGPSGPNWLATQHTTSEVDPGATTALSWGMSTSGRTQKCQAQQQLSEKRAGVDP